MAKIPVRFKRVAAAFDEAAHRVRPCESSGSEHYSPDNSTDLSDLVNSFMERELYNNTKEGDHHKEIDNDQVQLLESDPRYWSYSEAKNLLENLLNSSRSTDDNDDDDRVVRQEILAQTQLACGITGETPSQGFKRKLMSRLRDGGFDAGLCKSRWEKFGRHPSGDYEYVDVNVGGNRYIVEVSLAGEFEIARPTSRYNELLDVFPPVVICKPEALKQIVRLMCSAIRECMKGIGMHVPPWRRNGYMQAKWFGHYKRTMNEIPAAAASASVNKYYFAPTPRGTTSIGPEALAVKVNYYCRDDFASKVRLKVGYLTAAFDGNGID